MWQRITNIWSKELMGTVRDKKALRQSLLVPIIIGVIYAALNPILGGVFENRAEESLSQTLTVPTQGLEYADAGLLATLEGAGMTLEAYSGDLEAYVRSAETPIALIIPPDFSANVADERPAVVRVLINPSSGDPVGASANINRVIGAINAYNTLIVNQRLAERGLDPALLVAVTPEQETLTTPEQQGGFNAQFMLPILVAVVVVTGGLFIAIDVTAGEKERGTLESLLVTPATDVEIFTGKLLAVFSMTLFPLILTFVAFGVATNFLPESIGNGAYIAPAVIVGSVLVGIPLSLAVSVLLMIVAVRTKTFKDAQSAMTPISLGVMFPALAAAFLPPTSSVLYLIPAYGTSAVVARLATSGRMPLDGLILSSLGCLLLAAIGVVIALRLFDRERLLYSA